MKKIIDNRLNLPDCCPKSQSRVLVLPVLLIATFLIVELGVATISGSLSLLADAGHLFTDLAALGLSLGATWLTRRSRKNGGRLELIAALINGISLIAIALGIAISATHRLQTPSPEIAGLPMLVTALVGLGVNGVNALWLHDCSHHNLNLRGAFLHTLADLVSCVGVILAAIAISWRHWFWADGVISLLVAGFILVASLPLVVQTLGSLRQGNLSSDRPILCSCGSCACQAINPEQLLFPSLEDLIL